MVNPQDVSLNVQAAIKNMTNGEVFYFAIPLAMEALFAPKPPMEVGNLVAAWKSIDESLEVAAVVSGEW